MQVKLSCWGNNLVGFTFLADTPNGIQWKKPLYSYWKQFKKNTTAYAYDCREIPIVGVETEPSSSGRSSGGGADAFREDFRLKRRNGKPWKRMFCTTSETRTRQRRRRMKKKTRKTNCARLANYSVRYEKRQVRTVSDSSGYPRSGPTRVGHRLWQIDRKPVVAAVAAPKSGKFYRVPRLPAPRASRYVFLVFSWRNRRKSQFGFGLIVAFTNYVYPQ